MLDTIVLAKMLSSIYDCRKEGKMAQLTCELVRACFVQK